MCDRCRISVEQSETGRQLDAGYAPVSGQPFKHPLKVDRVMHTVVRTLQCDHVWRDGGESHVSIPVHVSYRMCMCVSYVNASQGHASALTLTYLCVLFNLVFHSLTIDEEEIFCVPFITGDSKMSNFSPPEVCKLLLCGPAYSKKIRTDG